MMPQCPGTAGAWEANMRGFALRAIWACLLIAPAAASAQTPVESFYKGRQVFFQVGSSPGDGYDLYARAIARHIGKFIPGKPNVVVQNVPGGGSLVLANQFGNVTAHDGSIFGMFNNGMATTPLLNPKAAQFDPRKFAWLGSPSREVQVYVAWRTAPGQTLDELLTKEIIVGASAPGAAPYDFPLMTNALLGTKFKIIAGYKGTADQGLAMERGEIYANPAVAWVSAKTTYKDQLATGKMKIVAQWGFQKHPELQGLPLFPTGKSEADQQMFQILYARQNYGRPLAAPPGTPAERVAALRAALDKTIHDPGFLADAARVGADISFVGGQELQDLTGRLYETPADVVAKILALLGTAK
jgi:tripartite-type tricarboxylate transporter receptor subunit TctC